MQMRTNCFRLAALLAFVLAPTAARADLILLGTTGTLGSGLGAVETVLTLQSPGSSTEAEGSVTLQCTLGGCTDFVSGDTTAINSTRSFDDAGITSASEFRLIFNANENDELITIESLFAYFYNSAGVQYHVARIR
jgi:hypothetical protein